MPPQVNKPTVAPGSNGLKQITKAGATPPKGPSGHFGKPKDEDFEVDLSEVSNAFCVPDGYYPGQVTDVIKDVAKSSNNDMYVWDFTIIGSSPEAGKTFKLYTALTPAALWKVAETLEALGLAQKGSVVKFKKGDAIGKRCGLKMVTEEYNGRNSSKIAQCVPLTDLDDALYSSGLGIDADKPLLPF